MLEPYQEQMAVASLPKSPVVAGLLATVYDVRVAPELSKYAHPILVAAVRNTPALEMADHHNTQIMDPGVQFQTLIWPRLAFVIVHVSIAPVPASLAEIDPAVQRQCQFAWGAHARLHCHFVRLILGAPLHQHSNKPARDLDCELATGVEAS